MKIVCDDKIPYIQPALYALADEVVLKPGTDICAADVRDADILVVRTRTRCNEHLLAGSSVRLVVTATIGYDHLDTTYLDSAGIQWTNCPGCNATSVAQYVHSSLLLLTRERHLRLHEATIGIIGVGHVGTAVCERLLAWDKKLHMLLCDPPREAAGDQAPCGQTWSPLEMLLAQSDIITLHTPLTTETPWPTHHLIDASAFEHMARRPILINAARGGVVDEEALEHALDTGLIQDAIIDTWEDEPHPKPTLLNKVYIGTPHIAGYSSDGKANATRMSLAAICRFLGHPMTFSVQPPPLPSDFSPSDDPDELALQLYDPRRDSLLLKAHPELFESLRGHYPLRREVIDLSN